MQTNVMNLFYTEHKVHDQINKIHQLFHVKQVSYVIKQQLLRIVFVYHIRDKMVIIIQIFGGFANGLFSSAAIVQG